MSCPKYWLPQVSLFLCFITLIGVIRQVQTHSVCFNGSSDTVIMNCNHSQSYIEVSSLLYADLQNQPQTCPGSVQEAICSEIINMGNLLRDNFVFSSCSATLGCSPAIRDHAWALQSCSLYNYFMANYTCVPKREMVDQCGNETRNVTSPTHLIYFHEPTNNSVQNCICVVQGGAHQIMAVNVKMPQTTKGCTNASLTVDWSKDGKKTSKQITESESTALTNEYLVNNSDITWIYYTRNCSKMTRNVWFKLYPVGDSQPVIYCGSSVADRPLTYTTTEITQSSVIPEGSNSPSNVSTATMNGTREEILTKTTDYVSSPMTSSGAGLSSTNQYQTGMSASTNSSPMSSTRVAKNSTPNTSPITNEDGNKSSKVAVIVGPVIGGFFALLIVVVLVIFLYRRHKSGKCTESAVPLNYGTHTAMYENTSVDLPLVVRSPLSHTNGYDHIEAGGTAEGTVNPGMHNNNNGGNVYNHTGEGEEYDHVQSVATVHPSSTAHHKPTDNTYNKLYQGHNRTGQLEDKDSLSESTTDTVNGTSATSTNAAAAIYSETPDKPQSGEREEDKGPASVSHESSGQMNEEIEFEENDMYKYVDRSNSARGPLRGAQGTHFYHVLQKEDFFSRVPEHPAHSAYKDVDHEQTDPSSPHESRGQSNDDTEFVENDLYQSGDQL